MLRGVGFFVLIFPACIFGFFSQFQDFSFEKLIFKNNPIKYFRIFEIAEYIKAR
jgi:hypothetical protein